MKTAQDFIEFFQAIPDENWNDDGQYEKIENPKCKCALGHLGWGYGEGNVTIATDEGKRLINILRPVGYVVYINDGILEFTNTGSTPKERIINALKQVKELS